jgi:hypothetical protein
MARWLILAICLSLPILPALAVVLIWWFDAL